MPVYTSGNYHDEEVVKMSRQLDMTPARQAVAFFFLAEPSFGQTFDEISAFIVNLVY